MRKFKMVGDLTSNPFHSSRIIIENINKAAKELDLYSDNGLVCCYDTLCNTHGHSPDAFHCAMELPFPRIILNNANGKPIIGLSQDNGWFAAEGGYPANLCNYVTLGVDNKVWSPVDRKKKDTFVFGASIESTVRSDIPAIVRAFGEVFGGMTNVVLYIKDRNATPLFETYLKEKAALYNIKLIHDNRHIENFEEERALFASWDAHIYLNRSGTFCMTLLQGMAVGCPSIGVAYSGPRDYLSHRINSLSVEYDLVSVSQQKIQELEQIGMRNFLFPFNFQNYAYEPYWAQCRLESVKDCMEQMVASPDLRDKLSQNGITTGEWFNWQRTAMNMSFVLNRFYPV
jgi:glycosyltransferase involved in cell wall biosynthesis